MTSPSKVVTTVRFGSGPASDRPAAVTVEGAGRGRKGSGGRKAADATDKQKHLRLNADERLLLDTVRQYLRLSSESVAAAEGLTILAEQLLAAYLAQGAHPQRCLVLLGALGAAAEGLDEQPRYRLDEQKRQLQRWHSPSGRYLPIEAVQAPWLPKSE